jgi:predicted membrane protein
MLHIEYYRNCCPLVTWLALIFYFRSVRRFVTNTHRLFKNVVFDDKYSFPNHVVLYDILRQVAIIYDFVLFVNKTLKHAQNAKVLWLNRKNLHQNNFSSKSPYVQDVRGSCAC